MQPAERDATLLRKAMDGTGTDEQVSDHVLTLTLLLNLFQRALLYGCQPASHCTFRRGLVRRSRLGPQPSGDASTAFLTTVESNALLGHKIALPKHAFRSSISNVLVSRDGCQRGLLRKNPLNKEMHVTARMDEGAHSLVASSVLYRLACTLTDVVVFCKQSRRALLYLCKGCASASFYLLLIFRANPFLYSSFFTQIGYHFLVCISQGITCRLWLPSCASSSKLPRLLLQILLHNKPAHSHLIAVLPVRT